jgi:hypothetical protein
MCTYVHILQNPVKVIKIEGNLNDKNSWRKPFAKQNANIFNGFWLIGLKSFSYNVKDTSSRRILNVHCNVVTGFEQNYAEPAKHCNPSISQIHLSTNVRGLQFKDFDRPSFFLINNVSDVLELDFSYLPTEADTPFMLDTKNIKFEAVFHYCCQNSS